MTVARILREKGREVLTIAPHHQLKDVVARLADGEPFTMPSALLDARRALRAARERRPQPTRDDKVVLEWNAMFASALVISGDETMERRGLALLDLLARTHFVDGVWVGLYSCLFLLK